MSPPRPPLLAALLLVAATSARSQEPPAEVGPAPLPPSVQVVRIAGPEGLAVDVLGPSTEPVPVGDGRGAATLGMKVGTAYSLKLTGLPNRPDDALYPVVEVIGHLHRPDGVDPAKFPIRVNLEYEDIEAALNGRLVTRVVYLEDPERAVPIATSKDETPTMTIGPAEDPLKVAMALGRVLAIIRLGTRVPGRDEANAGGGTGLAGGRCEWIGSTGTACGAPCGPCRPSERPERPTLARDEYLCDGGDHKLKAGIAGLDSIVGVEPKDALIKFRDDRGSRVLPTNTVCIYAPRFAVVRGVVGLNVNLGITAITTASRADQQRLSATFQRAGRYAQNTTAELARHRARPSDLGSVLKLADHAEVRVLGETDVVSSLAGHVALQRAQAEKLRQKVAGNVARQRLVGIKTAESAVVTGLVQGLGQSVMAWKPDEQVGVELPPKKAGIAVIKRVSAGEAEAGEVVTFVIQYRNMGNVPIGSVSVIDSLLARLEYVPGSAKGPARSVFTAEENQAGSSILRWDLPGEVAPGAEGYVSFEAKVR